jgi:uncharacterized protein YdeI (YjbR/CyaY-like superfamily)
MNPKVDFYFEKAEQWKTGILQLRKIALSCGLEEELKWGVPCYSFEGKNIVLIHVFKEYFAYLFFKGSLLSDVDGILVQQSKNVQAARHIRFTDAKQITKLQAALKRYIYEAIEIEKAGLKVQLKKTSDYEVPAEFEKLLKRNAKVKKAFAELTPGRQRGYLLHFAAAKQAATREARIEKAIPDILVGKGLNDR